MIQASFGSLLRESRLEAGLTQEALAERSGLGIRSLQGLERGESHPRRETLRRLREALELSADQLREFERLATPSPRQHRVAQPSARSAPADVPAETSSSDPAASLAMPGERASRTLVGRDDELDLLRKRLREAMTDCGNVVLLGGEPGIGKTRLAEEVAFEAAQHGMLVVWGRCWESDGAPPFWPWIELLRDVMRNCDQSALRHQLSNGASLIATLVPELREQFPDLPAMPQLDPAEARFRLFDAVTTLFRNKCSARPMLLLVEDLHCADKPSLLLLEFLVQRVAGVRLLVVGTYRDTELAPDHPLAEMLGAAGREQAFDIISLHGLDSQAVGELVASWLDHPLPTEATDLVHALWHATNGNPLFVREEVRSLIEDGRWPQDGAATGGLRFGLSRRVRDVITRRLARLSSAARDVLTIASVVGREFAVATVEQACGLEATELDTALDTAQLARVIEELPRPSPGYRFSHALFREALYADLPARRRRRLHRQVAEALELVHARDLDAHASELAYHYGEAQTQSGYDKFVHYALLAGERALDSNAFEEAAAHFQRGLDALSGRPMDEQQAALLSGLGRAQAALLELPRAQEVVGNLMRAFNYYASSGDIDRAVVVAECPVDALPGQVVGGARLVARALELVEPDSHAAGRLLARYARMLTIEAGDYQAATEACRRAVSIAQREGDVHLEIQALGNGAEADLNYFRWHEGLLKCERAIELARLHGALHAEMYARFFACIMLWLSGDLAQAGEYAAVLLARAEQLRDHRWRVAAVWLAGTSAHDRGDWAVARAATDRGLELSQGDPRLLWTRIVVEHSVGDMSVVKSLVTRLLDVVPLSPAVPDLAQASTALVLVSLPDAVVSANERAMAESTADAILSLRTITDVVATNARVSLAFGALQRGDAAALQRHYPLLQHVRGTLILYLGMAGDRLLGRLARAIGERDLATQHFDDAMRFCRDNSCRPELAWLCYDYADLLLANGDAAHRARQLLDEAVTLSRNLGMQHLMALAREAVSTNTHPPRTELGA